jgi:Na+-transporting methylmalonyl-CoA/oxaloacetate decarboxylase gamma subunit
MNTVIQGLSITLIGMTLVFFALGLIVVAMQLMRRFLPARSAPKAKDTGPGLAVEERTRVAAIAAAIVVARQAVPPPAEGTRQPGAAGGDPSPWQAAHRARALASRPGERRAHR